jgi:hypothetical protein
MSEHSRIDAGYWRQRAAEVLLAAESVKDRDARTTLLRIAEDYERLAMRADERARASSDAK